MSREETLDYLASQVRHMNATIKQLQIDMAKEPNDKLRGAFAKVIKQSRLKRDNLIKEMEKL